MNNTKNICGFDWLRVCGAFAVVWIHGCDTNAAALRMSGYCSFAVPCFIMMSFFLLQGALFRKPARNYRQVVKSRVLRLLPSFIVWSCAYVLIRLAKQWLFGDSSLVFNRETLLSVLFFGGASYQLYFIPELIYFSLIFIPIMLLIARQEGGWLWSLIMLSSGIILYYSNSWLSLPSVPPGFSMLNHARGQVCFVPLGISLSCLWVQYGQNLSMKYRWLLAALFLAFWFVVRVFGEQYGENYRFLSVISLFAGFVVFPLPAGSVMKRFAMFSYGMYLNHGIFVEFFQNVFFHLGWPLESFGLTLTVILCSFLCAYLCCETIFSVKKLRWLL